MPSRMNYWSCSRFADWLRGTAKLKAGTSKEWRLWKEAAKESHPIRYWIVEEGLDSLQNFFNWPLDKLNDVRYYFINRFITRSHALTAHARDIKPGSWCDVGNRFLPCLFNELVNFVEVEQAWHHCIWDEEARKKYAVPWWQRHWYTRWGREWRCPDAGIEHLIWASGLKIDESMGADPTSENYGAPTGQALGAQEILALYRWWKVERPKRPDVYDASGWSTYCEQRREKGHDFFDLEDKSEEEADTSRKALDRIQEMEKAYDDEDEAMMIRLIKVRDSLWT
jgi:hypothetical protein